MESFILLFKPYRAWLGRCLGLLVGVLLMMTQEGWGQIYSAAHFGTPALKYFDVTTNAWTAKASPSEALVSLTFYKGKIYGSAIGTTNFYLYDPVTDTWSNKASSPVTDVRLETAGDYIYAIKPTNPAVFFRYDPITNAWTSLSNVGLTPYATSLAYDGGDYIYCGGGTVTKNIITRYSISGNTWTTLPTAPASADIVTLKSGKLYLTGTTQAVFYSFNPSTSTYTQLANPAASNNYILIRGEGNYLYLEGSPATNLQRYDISTNTWTTYTGPGDNYYGATSTYLGYCAVTGSATATPATCLSGGGANADAKLTLNTYSSGVTKVGYSAGSGYTGPAFATATAITAAPIVLSNTLTNPTVPQPYTIRIFQDATCYKDVVASLAPTLCLTSDLGLSLSPTVQSGTKGELLTYTLTLTNAGPDAASNVKVDVKVPTNATLLTAIPQLGTYNSATHKWEMNSLPIGSKTLTVTLKMN